MRTSGTIAVTGLTLIALIAAFASIPDGTNGKQITKYDLCSQKMMTRRQTGKSSARSVIVTKHVKTFPITLRASGFQKSTLE